MQPALAQTPVTLASDGAWTWYNDPRAIFKDGLLYFGYMRAGDGRAALSVYNPQTAGEATALWSSTWVEKDDHNNPALLPLQDGRMMAFYARHSTNITSFNHRLSIDTTPSLPGDWGAEQTYTSAERISYANPFQLSAESGRVYNFMRNLNYNPTFVTSDNFGTSWSAAKILIQTGSGGSTRPYVKYASNGTDRIDFFYSDGHPRDLDNSLYHGYYKNGSLYKTDGTLLKTLAGAPLLHDSGERGSVIYQYSSAATADPNAHIPTGRAWCWDLAYGAGGHPVATFSVQRDNVTGPAWSDDRIYYYYARWVPGTGWQKRFVAHAGRPLYESEDDYAGGIALDPLDPNVIYISTNAANPFNLGNMTNVPLNANARYEIYRGVTTDGGLTFNWQPITQNSAVDNLRPYVPRDRTDFTCALVWFAGTYTTYTSWNSQVKGLFTNSLNQPPGITITSPAGASAALENTGSKLRLTASASDDGTPGPLSVQWAVVSGPSGATFANATSADTTVSFTQSGQYLLRATATDSSLTASADVLVTIGSATSSPNLHLKLDESTGLVAADSSGQANHGTLQGGATWQPSGGKVNGALALNGTTGYVNILDANSLEPGGAFTLAYWVRVTSYNTSGSGLVSKRDGPATNNAYTTFLNGNAGDTTGYKRITVDIDGTGDRFTSNTEIALNTWYHVALVFNGAEPASQRATLWINGVLDRTAAETSASVPNSPASVKAGLTHSSVSSFLKGRLDDVRFFQEALTENQIAALAGTLNFAPIVATGPAPAAVSGETAILNGTAIDDGIGGPLSSVWSKVSGPGSVSFGDATNPSTTVVFSQPGNYTLRLLASDTQVETSADLFVSVEPNLKIYAGWISAAFPNETDPAIVGAEADPDRDGVTNLVEFALGLNPANPDAGPQGPGLPGLPTASVRPIEGTDRLVLEVRRPVGLADITYTAQVSGDLMTWAGGVEVTPPTANGDGTETVLFRDTVASGTSRRFIRLRVLSDN